MNALLEKLKANGAQVDTTLRRMLGDEEMYVEYLHKFPQNPNITALREAVAAGEEERASKEAHSLKGVALNLGLLDLGDLCADMRALFLNGENDEAMAMASEINACFAKWAAVIEE